VAKQDQEQHKPLLTLHFGSLTRHTPKKYLTGIAIAARELVITVEKHSMRMFKVVRSKFLHMPDLVQL
jgi:hypothetical protein